MREYVGMCCCWSYWCAGFGERDETIIGPWLTRRDRLGGMVKPQTKRSRKKGDVALRTVFG